DIWRLFSKRRNSTRSTDDAENKANCGHVCEQKKQEVQKIRESGIGQPSDSAGLSFNSMELRTPVSPSSNSSDITNNQQSDQGKDNCSISSTILASSTMVAKHIQNNEEIRDSRRKRRRIKDGRKDEKAEEASSTGQDDDCSDRGERGESLFRWALQQRGLDDEAIQGVIEGWHCAWRRHRLRLGQFQEYWEEQNKVKEDILAVQDPEAVISNFISFLKQHKATNANQIACRTAAGMLFRAIGQEEQKINGFALKQIMKKPSIAVAKELGEEPIWGFNKLLNYVKKKALNIQLLSEQELMGIFISVIMGYSTLRLTEKHRASAEKTDEGNWQLHTHIIKVKGYKATLTFHTLADLNNRHATYDECSKATHLIMKQAGIKDNPPVTSIRKSSMTKAIDQGSNKQQINRFSRHKQGSIIVQTNYDMNLNDTIRERLAKL
ncbi:MAG: hypothetical protein EZS28_033580, partial [Streblomastix strix]